LTAIFGGRQVLIESPLIQEIVDEAKREQAHKDILQGLQERFGPVPEDLASHVRAIPDEQRLRLLLRHAWQCSDLGAFRAALPT
jgi:hypothetical protein